MNELRKSITVADTTVLWELLADVSGVLKAKGYSMDKGNHAFMVWYAVYKELEAEIDRRLQSEQ